MNLAPNTYRPGVIAGFALGLATGLVPSLSMGVLFANGQRWQPASPPAAPAAPASSLRYLAYNTTAGLYWTGNQNGDNAGDAVLGWAETNATDLIAVSNQVIATVADAASTSSSSGSGSSSVPESQTAAEVDSCETPTGSLNGSNAVFHLVSVPVENSLELVLNGVVQAAGVDFAVVGNVVTYTVAPKTTDWHRAWYQAAV